MRDDFSGIRGIVFDAVGTILLPEPRFPVVYRTIAARFGIAGDEAVIFERFLQAFRESDAEDLPLGLRVDEDRERRRWRGIVAAVFAEHLGYGEFERLFSELFLHYSLPESWVLFDDVASTWHWLQDRGYRVGIGSNYDSRLQSVVAGHEPLSAHHGLFISSLVGRRKPAVEFFQAIADDWGLSADQLLMIGDDPENDYHGAIAAGWRSLVIDRADKYPALPRIFRLTDLISLLPPNPI